MSYWEYRQKQLKEQLEKDERKLKKRLSDYYDKESRRLEKNIAAYYQEYGENNVIEYRRLMQRLSDDDIRLLMEQMDRFAVRYPEYANLMPIRESIYKLNRLEGLQTSIKMQQLEIGAINNEQLTEHLNKQAMRGVNAAAETLGFGKNFYANNPDITKLFVNVPWANGENFSTKIWNNTSKLSNYLTTDIAQGLARGDSYAKLVNQLKDRFGRVERNDIYRLIYTEGTYVMAESAMHPFKEAFEKYRISTVGDGKVCTICRGAAQQVFDIKDRQPGVNFPPFHAWCRCTFTIVVDDWDKWLDDYEKRHSNGQTEKVANRFRDGKELGKYNSGVNRIGTNEVKLDYIKSREFRNKFSRITNSTSVNESLRTYATAILTHRSGTDGEDLYIINSKTGELLLRKISGTDELGVAVTAKEINEVRGKYFGQMIGIHNHPTNIYPTGSDFAAAGYRGYAFGVMVTHEGRVFTYNAGNKPFLPRLFDERVDKYVDAPYNLSIEKAHERALKEFEKEYGITWTEITGNSST